MKIPVLYLIDYMYIYSGTEKHLVDLLRNINRERYEPYVVTFRGSEELKKSIESMGIPVRILGMSRIYGLKQFALFFELRKFIRTKRIKVMQTFHTNPDIYGALLAKLSGVPVLISSRRDLGFNRNKRHVLLYRLLNRYVDMIICVSRAVREFVMREEGVLAGKTRVIYNGIKPEELDRAVNVREERKKHGFDETQPVIGMLSNFNNVKGHKYFIEAAALIKQAVPEAQFIVVGREGPAYGSMLRKTAELGLGGCVHFLGYRRDILELLSVMDILVAPSLSEGFSNTILEALYMKKPVVATAVGGNTEIIADNENGVLIPPSSHLGIYEAVVRLIREKELARRLGENGRKTVEHSFLLGDRIAETETLYEYLLKSKGVPECGPQQA